DKASREVVVALLAGMGLAALHGGALANSAATEALTSVLIFRNRQYRADHAGLRIIGIDSAAGAVCPAWPRSSYATCCRPDHRLRLRDRSSCKVSAMSVVLLERPREGVALLRLNRPDRLNALNMAVREALASHFVTLSSDDAIRCVVVTGDEKAFAAGADVAELAKRTPTDEAFSRSRAAWAALERYRRPIIAAVSGFALGGGCELAMHCDIIIAGEGAKLGQPEVKLGIMPGAGGTQRFVRAAGKFAALRWLLTGDLLSAAEAHRLGLVSEVVPDGEVLPHALEIATRIAALPPLAVAAIKEAVLLGADLPLDAALRLEAEAFQTLFATEDRAEGMRAFLEKRKPEFKGR